MDVGDNRASWTGNLRERTQQPMGHNMKRYGAARALLG